MGVSCHLNENDGQQIWILVVIWMKMMDEMCMKIWVQWSWFKVQGLCDCFVESQILQVTSRF
jgi:hypothetical protein